MLFVTKTEPDFFSDKKKKIKNQKSSDAWDEIGDIRADLREYILTNEQDGMCAYCEKKITSDKDKSNIDHFKTRNHFPNLTLEYDNLFVSCNNQNHCSNKKDNLGLQKDEFEEILNPASNEVKNSFSYKAGIMIGKTSKAKYTIDVFNLNNISLEKERNKIVQNFEYYKELDTSVLIDALGGHKNLILHLKSENNG
jgi:uncharacterized protein (TIGR02646 family)